MICAADTSLSVIVTASDALYAADPVTLPQDAIYFVRLADCCADAAAAGIVILISDIPEIIF